MEIGRWKENRKRAGEEEHGREIRGGEVTRRRNKDELPIQKKSRKRK